MPSATGSVERPPRSRSMTCETACRTAPIPTPARAKSNASRMNRASSNTAPSPIWNAPTSWKRWRLYGGYVASCS
jgi:hypothetical protein